MKPLNESVLKKLAQKAVRAKLLYPVTIDCVSYTEHKGKLTYYFHFNASCFKQIKFKVSSEDIICWDFIYYASKRNVRTPNLRKAVLFDKLYTVYEILDYLVNYHHKKAPIPRFTMVDVMVKSYIKKWYIH